MTGMKIPKTPSTKTLGGAAAAAMLAGGIAVLAVSPSIDLDAYSRTATADVSAGTDTITVTMDFTSVNDLVDVSATYVSPTSGTERGCTVYDPTSGTRKVGTWDCVITLLEDDDGGDWALKHISARDDPADKNKKTQAEIISAGDVECNGGPGFCTLASDFEVAVTSGTEDVTPPVVTAAATSPEVLFQIFGGTLACVGTATGTAVEAGCNSINRVALTSGKSYATEGCVDLSPAGNDFACNMVVEPGQAAGTYTVDGFARDANGNRDTLEDSDSYVLQTGGLVYTSCTVGTVGPLIAGYPLAVEVDEDGDGWMIAEFSNVISYFNKNDDPCAADMLLVPLSDDYPPFAGVAGYSTSSVFGESIKEDPVRDVIWFSQGGASTYGGANFNHSRIGEYTPGSPDKETGGTWRMFNVPGIRNEVQGLYVDQERGWIWATESGQFKDFDGTPYGSGSIVAFDWDSAGLWDNTYEWEWGTCDGGVNVGDPCHVQDVATDCPLSTCSEINADGQLASKMCGVGENPTDDACWKRWLLGGFNTATSHIVGDQDGRMYFTNFWGASIGRLDPVTDTNVRYPLRTLRHDWFPGSFVGVGPWEIDISNDGRYVAWGEYFDNSYGRLAVNRSGDAECQDISDEIMPELLAWYRFDDADGCTGGIDDSSGKGNSGTCQGNPTWTGSDGSPTADGALVLDGSGDYIDIATEDLFDFPKGFAITMWVKADASQSGTYNVLVSKGDSSYSVRRNNATTDLSAETFYTTAPNTATIPSATRNIWDGTWHHVSFNYYYGWGKQIAIDGIYGASSTTHTLKLDWNNFELRVGGNEEAGGGSDLAATVDDIRVWSRPLRPEEVYEVIQDNRALGGTNPCIERIEVPFTDAELFEFKTHSQAYDSKGSFWYSQDASTRGPAIVQTGLGIVDPSWTHATTTNSADFNPDYNDADKVFSGLAINDDTDEMWVAEFDPRAMGRYVPVVDQVATDIRRVTITLPAASYTGSASLTGLLTSNAIPFATTRVTTAAGVAQGIENYAVDVYFSGGNVVAERATASGALVVEVAVVAFNPGRVKVQSGTWSMAALVKTDNLAIDSVDLDRAFPIVYGEQNSVAHTWQNFHHRDTFTSPVNLRIERSAATSAGIYNGHYYVAEALGTEWLVQPVSYTLAVGSGALFAAGYWDATLAPEERTFLLGSYMGANADYDNGKSLMSVQEVPIGGDIGVISFYRYNGIGANLFWQGYMVTLAEGQGSVQRVNPTTITTTDSRTLGTPVDVSGVDSMAIFQGATNVGEGAESGSTVARVPQGFAALDIVSGGTQVRTQKLGSDFTNTWQIEVITWDLP